jgi:hypothetical protein
LTFIHVFDVPENHDVFLMLLSTIRRIASDLLGLSGCNRLHLSSASRKSGDSLIEVTACCPVAGRPRRFVFVKDKIAQAAQSLLDFPPMQKGASFNLEALKEELEKKMASRGAQ